MNRQSLGNAKPSIPASMAPPAPSELAVADPVAMPGWRARLDKFLTRRTLGVLLAVSLVGQVLLVTALARKGTTEPDRPRGEVALGSFSYAPEPADGMPVLGARFQLHLAFHEAGDESGRRTLAQREFRVREGIEELLRKAHPGDFRDPALSDLKRQLQDRINEALGMAAVSEIIITGLDLARPGPATRGPSEDGGARSTAAARQPSSGVTDGTVQDVGL